MTGVDPLPEQVDDPKAEWAEVLRLQREAVDAWELAAAAFSPASAEGAEKINTAVQAIMDADADVIGTPAPDIAGLVVKLETAWRPQYEPDEGWQEAILEDARRLADEAQATAWPADWSISMDEDRPKRRSTAR